MAWGVDPDDGNCHLVVRLGHPRNQNLYLYHSETGSVDVLRYDVHTILFFPDGQCVQLPR